VYAIDIRHLSEVTPPEVETGPPKYKWPPIMGDNKFMSGVAVDPATDLLYTGGHDKKIRCIDFHTGHVKWEFTTKRYVLSSPVVVNNAVVVGSSDGHVYALDKNHGTLIWNFLNGRTGRITSSVAVSLDGSYLMYASDSHSFTATNNCKGKPGSLHVVALNGKSRESSQNKEEQEQSGDVNMDMEDDDEEDSPDGTNAEHVDGGDQEL